MQMTDKEHLFQKRIADLRMQNEQFPWTSGDNPQYEIPREDAKLHSERDSEGKDVSDAELERRALLDLTSQNFKTFYKRLNYELRRARRYARPCSLCLVGIDAFEELGTHIGPEAKTAAVDGAGRLLLGSIRDVDIAGRCREDTFGVILPETPRSGAEVAAERIRTRLEKHVIASIWQPFTITVSVGVSFFPDGVLELEEMFAQAAEALLANMRHGGNRVSLGRPFKV